MTSLDIACLLALFIAGADGAWNASCWLRRHPTLCLDWRSSDPVRVISLEHGCNGDPVEEEPLPVFLRAAGMSEDIKHFDGGISFGEGDGEGGAMTRISKEIWNAVSVISGVGVELSRDRTRDNMDRIVEMILDGRADVLVNVIDICCGREATMKAALPILPRFCNLFSCLMLC